MWLWMAAYSENSARIVFNSASCPSRETEMWQRCQAVMRCSSAVLPEHATAPECLVQQPLLCGCWTEFLHIGFAAGCLIHSVIFRPGGVKGATCRTSG